MKLIITDTTADRYSLIADSALTLPGRPTFLPDIAEAATWEARPLLAVRVSRLGKSIAPRFASRYFDAVTAALRLVPLDASGAELTSISSVIDFGLTLGQWLPTADTVADALSVNLNGSTAEITDFQTLISNTIAALSVYTTLKMGDILLLPMPLPGRSVTVGQAIDMTINGAPLLSMRIK